MEPDADIIAGSDVGDRPSCGSVRVPAQAAEDDQRPYFLWDTRMTAGELRRRLREATEEERLLWIGRILREASYGDVWQFLTVEDVVSRWDRLRGRLGRKNAFWEFLIAGWRRHGLVAPR